MMAYYQGWIALRRARFTDPEAPCAFLTAIAPTAELLENNVIAVTWADDAGAVGYAVINPTAKALSLELPEGWTACRVMALGDQVLPDAAPQDGPIPVEPCSVTLAVRAE